MPFKMHKILFFFQIKKIIKTKYLHYLKFSDMLPETHLFFIFILYNAGDEQNCGVKIENIFSMRQFFIVPTTYVLV